MNIVPIRKSIRKKVTKNRGIIDKNSFVEIDYVMDSQHFRRRLVIYFTFYQKVEIAKMSLEGKSMKFWKKLDLELNSPKTNVQFQSILDLEKVKLYEYQGIQNSYRFIKPKISIAIADF